MYKNYNIEFFYFYIFQNKNNFKKKIIMSI